MQILNPAPHAVVPVGDGHGRPLYRAEPGDDVEAILAHLRERVGERGYRFVGADESEHELPQSR